jgi:hypothetical protein
MAKLSTYLAINMKRVATLFLRSFMHLEYGNNQLRAVLIKGSRGSRVL